MAKRSSRFFALGIDVILGVAIFVGSIVMMSQTSAGWVRFVPMLVVWSYPVVTVGLWGKTLGQHVVGLRVVRVDDYGLPGLRRAAVRTLALFIPAVFVPGGIGHGAAVAAKGSFVLSETRQGAHDRLAGTLVLNEIEWKALSEVDD